MPRKPETKEKDGDEGLDRTELESIKRVFERLDRKNDGKIDRDEIAQQLDLLGYKPRRHTDYGTSEVEDMIWEVDEDCDGMIDWDNFVQLYIRCRRDKTGWVTNGRDTGLLFEAWAPSMPLRCPPADVTNSL